MNDDGSLELGARLNNKENGRCIKMYSDGRIFIDYKKDGWSKVGNYVSIYSCGNIWVGERYMDNGAIQFRGTAYNEDGTTDNIGDNL